MEKKYPAKKLWEVYIKNKKLAKFIHVDKIPVQRMSELEWLVQARNNLEQPINLPATEYTELNYVLILYNKAAIAFNYLRAYLGDSEFDAAMQEYYNQWKFRHPQPEDLREILETQSDKNLSWFFTDLLGTTKRLDYKMVRIENQRVLIKNKGELVSPLFISGTTGDSIIFEKWEEGFKGKKWVDLPTGDYAEIIIDPGHVTPEISRMNNNIKKNSTFPKTDPLKTQLLFSVDDPEKHTLMFMPAINWTRENGIMFGMAFHNGFIIPKPLEYFVMPFYAFGNSDLAGFGRINYNLTPFDKFIRLATISLEATQFGAPGNQNYRKIKTGLELHFRNEKMTYPLNQSMFGNYITASNLFQIELQEKAKMNSYIQFGYLLEKPGFVNPFTLLASFEAGKSYKKISIEYNYKISYFGRDNGLDIRLFAGTMLKSDPNVPFFAFSPGGRSGRQQYLYQGTYPDRFSVFPKNFFSRQMTLSEGGLVSPVHDSIGYSSWLISMSLTSNLPGKAARFPVKPFLNILFNDHGMSVDQISPFFYEVGIKTGIWDFFEIYIPLLVSKNIDSVNGTFKNRIRFVFSLDSFSRLKLNSKAEF
jgi:hypothetical protein